MIVDDDPSQMPPWRVLAYADPKTLGDSEPDQPTTMHELMADISTLDEPKANLVTSKLMFDEEHHAPVLDIDFDCTLLSSSTSGHHHLYLNGIDPPLTWEEYSKLLDALLEARIIGPGYHRHSIARGYTSLRRPHVRKPVAVVDPDEPF